MAELLITGPKDAAWRFLCAHGAGKGMVSPFLDAIAALLAERGIAVVRFEFGYMAARRDGGRTSRRRKAERLMDEYRAALVALAAEGRPAADRRQVDGRARRQPGGRRIVRGAAHRRPGLPRLSVPSPQQAGEAAHGAPRSARLSGADRAGRARSLRHAGGGRGDAPVPSYPDQLLQRRRPRSWAARCARDLPARATWLLRPMRLRSLRRAWRRAQ